MCEDGHCKEDEKFSVLTYLGETNIHTRAHTHCGPGSCLSFE